MSPKKEIRKSTSSNTAKGFTDEEKAAMKERAQELKAEARASKDRAVGESAILATIAAMKEPDRAMATRLHAIITASAPTLSPKTWYGMPAYANKDGKIICFFQAASKFNTRYATRSRNEFLESAEVHGNFYGTSRTWLEQQLSAGHDVLLEIDWQGAQQVRQCFRDTVGIFILPPSMAELERRLRSRNTDSDATISRRLLAALTEMRHVDEFEYVIINDNLQDALDDLQAAVHASRLRLAQQQARHPELFTQLFQE